MKFAIIDGIRTEATKGAKGFCPKCNSELVAKCGSIKIHHWAHKNNRNCDQWWEPETEWHRQWKNKYPSDWQEITLFDEHTNEKHIADIKTKFDLVIEFQHSPISKEERISREKFYKNMIWVVDGTRMKHDYPRFLHEKNNLFFKSTFQDPDLFHAEFPNKLFPANWLGSPVPIFFDFKGLSADDKDETKNALWCLIPVDKEQTFVKKMTHDDFIERTLNTSSLFEQVSMIPDQINPLPQKPITKIQVQRPKLTYYLETRMVRTKRKNRL